MKKIILSLVCALATVHGVAAVGQTPPPQSQAGKSAASAADKRAAKFRPGRRRVVKTVRAPQAIGPYSQAIVAQAGELVFTSGQIAIDPQTGEMSAGGIAEQTELTLRNLAAVLEASGSDMPHVLKTTVFLADMDDFAAMNEVYRRHFTGEPPARSTVQVARLPRNARIEIEAVALVKKR